jgi:lipopolysaccharide transport system permease protein
VQTKVALDQNQVVAAVGDDPLVSQEIRYDVPRAGKVTLVWGINGWLPLPEYLQPANTDLVEGAMRTPMALQGGAFVVQVPVPVGATIDFTFLITETSSGTRTEVLDANGELDPGYSASVVQGQAVEVKASPSVTAALDRTEHVVGQTRATLVLATVICAVAGVILVRAWFALHPRGSQAKNATGLSRKQTWIHRFDLVKELVVRDTKLRYRGSVLGIAWSLLNPLSYMLVFTFLTRRVLSFNVPNYPAFVFIGTLAWSWLQTSVTLSAAITDNRTLVKRPGFPSAILPVTVVSTNLIQFLLALIVPLVYFLVRGGRITFVALMLPLVVIPQFLLTLGLGYLAATFQVRFRDTRHILGVLFRILYFLTPIFYAASMVPKRYEAIYRLNPMYHLVTAYRTILIYGHVPDLLVLAILGLMGIILLWIGHVVFARSSPRFVEEL